MISLLHLAIFIVSSATARVAEVAFAESLDQNIESKPWKFLQKTNYDGWSASRKNAGSNQHTITINVPTEFDARQYFMKCRHIIADVKDQGNCASSWAVVVASTFTDRLCIATNGNFTKNLSAQNLMACGDSEQLGCNGGSAFRAWEFITSKGIVTGGNFGSKEGCQPYRRRPCNHYGPSDTKNCTDLGPMQKTICRKKCLNNNYKIEYNNDLHKTSNVYMTPGTNVTLIQQEIVTYGPVTALMYVYENFVEYKNGIYKATGGSLVGYQYVKLIGWGVDENGIEYWLAMNSWNSNWGDQGLFKILRGYNFCSIELLVMAGVVSL